MACLGQIRMGSLSVPRLHRELRARSDTHDMGQFSKFSKSNGMDQLKKNDTNFVTIFKL